MSRSGTTASPIRVALVTGQLGYGGAERQLTELAIRAGARGVSVEVFCLGGTDEPHGATLRSQAIPLTILERRGGFDLRRALDLAASFRRGSFDLVHSFLIDCNPYAFLASRLAGVATFVASNRNADFERGPVRAAIDGLVFRRADGIVVNAGAVRDFTARRFGVAADRFTVIANGVDPERFRPPEKASAGLPTIGTVGSLTPKKNPDLFGRLARALRDRFPQARWLHLGDGPLRGELASRYGALVSYLGNADTPESFLAGLDVFVLTSDREGCPNALLEAMACGRAVVTTDAGGAPEIVRDGESGFLVPRGSLDSLAERTGRLLDDRALRERIGAAARLEAERRFGMARMVEEMVGLYRRLHQTHPARKAA